MTTTYFKNKLHLSSGTIFLGIVVCQPLLDAIAYFQYDNKFGSLAGYLRLFFSLALALFVFIDSKEKRKVFFSFLPIALIGFFHFLNGFRVGYISIFDDLMYFMRAWYLPILFVCFYWFFKNRQKQLINIIPKAFFINTLIIVGIVFISWLTKTGRFTYTTFNVGLTGWFGDANSQSLIIVSLIPLSLYFLFTHCKKHIQMICLILFTALLLTNGTRATFYSLFIIYIGVLAFILFEYCLKHKDNAKFPATCFIMIFLCLVASAALAPYTPRHQVDTFANYAQSTEKEKVDKLVDSSSSGNSSSAQSEELPKPNPDLNSSPNDSNHSVNEENPSTSSSESQNLEIYYRERINPNLIERFGFERVLNAYGGNPSVEDMYDMRLKKRIFGKLTWEDCDPITKLVGFEHAKMYTASDNFDLENDVEAIFYYYGYIGAIIYIAPLLLVLFKVGKKVICDFKRSMNLLNFSLIITLMLQIGLAVFSGYLLRRPNASFYSAIIMILCYYRSKVSTAKV